MMSREKDILSIQTKKDAIKVGQKLGLKWRMVYYRKAELGSKFEELKLKLASLRKVNLYNLANEFSFPPDVVLLAVERLRDEGYLFDIDQNTIKRGATIEPPKPVSIDMSMYHNRWIKFGVVSDTHLNSKYQRLDALNAMYDIFEEEGIKNVFHAGNMIDGFARFNQFDVFNIGLNEQVAYAVKAYPQRRGIITHFVTADDHEGWYVQREHVNVGKIIENAAIEAGRKDLHHLGYIESDVQVRIGESPTVIRVMHPGGGSAYAMSYQPQKIIESMSGGEKPDFLIIGHYHKSLSGKVRNVPYVQAGCFEDQTPFMRKKHIEAHVGGWIVELHIAPDGHISRIRPEWIDFYNKKFYLNKREKRPVNNWEYKW